LEYTPDRFRGRVQIKIKIMKVIDAMNLIRARERLGDDIRRIREAKGLSKSKIFRKTGLQRSQLIAVEKGTKSYTIDTLLLILDTLETKLKIEDHGNNNA